MIFGSGIGGLNEIETQHQRLLERGPDKVSPFTIPKLMANAAAGHVSIQYGLKGINTTVATACASATNATGDAFHAIQYGDADIMISGGAESAITPMGVSAFANMRALSERNDNPGRRQPSIRQGPRRLRPSAKAPAMFVLEELEHARRRGAKIYAELLGYGASGDGGHITQPDEQGTGAARAMSAALRQRERPAARKSDTSTPTARARRSGDKAETIAIKRVFGDCRQGRQHFEHQEPAWPLARGQRRRRVRHLRPRASRRRHPADDQLPRRPTRTAISTTRPTSRASANQDRHEQQFWLRRPQRVRRRRPPPQRRGRLLCEHVGWVKSRERPTRCITHPTSRVSCRARTPRSASRSRRRRWSAARRGRSRFGRPSE